MLYQRMSPCAPQSRNWTNRNSRNCCAEWRPPGKSAASRRSFFAAWMFNILIDNTDDHEKNHALLRPADGHYLLSPASDVVPSAQGLGYQAMGIGDQGTESTLANALWQARQFGLKADVALAIITEVAIKVDGWIEAFAAKGVLAADIDLLAQYIDSNRLHSQ